MNAPLVERYRERIAGVLTYYDRIVITGTLPGACHAAGNDELSERAAHSHF
jgi:hypothetical protein